MFQTKVEEKVKTCVLCSITYFLPESLGVCEIMWKNITVQPARTQMAIWRMHFACRITKATHTHTHAHAHTYTHTLTLTICNTYRFATATMVACRRLSVTFTHTLSVLLVLHNEISIAVYRRDYMQHRNTRTLRGLNAGLISVKSDTIRLPIRITKLIFLMVLCISKFIS